MPFRKETWEGWSHADIWRWLYLLIVVISAAGMAVLFVLIVNDRNSLRREANIRATQIQQQRYDATFQLCVNQNERHNKTIHRLHLLVLKNVKQGKIPKSQVKNIEKQNDFLIDALAPKQNCKVVASKAVHPLPAPNRENP